MKRAVLFATGVLLAGCNTFPDVDFLLNDPTATGGSAGTGQPPNTRATPGGNGVDINRNAYANRPAPIPKKKPRRIVGIEPDRLVGMTRNQVQDLIGLPVTVADKPPATVWSYRSTACALEVFFYLDVGSKTFRALTYQVKGEKGGTIAPTLCLGQIWAVNYGS